MRFAAFLLLFAGQLMADVISYQGRVKIDGKPFTGVGHFKFAVVDGQGSTTWSSQEMVVAVRQGIYTVRLGDSAQAPPIDGASLLPENSPRLRILFEQKQNGWVSMGGDVPLATGQAPDAASAPPGDQAPQPMMTQSQGAAILAELRSVHALLLARKGDTGQGVIQPAVTLSIGDMPSLGRVNAPVVLVEFTDLQNPLCVWFQNAVFGRLKTTYIDSGSLRFVSRVLPQPFDSSAELAARAAICARSWGQYWPLREKLLTGGPLSAEALAKAAAGVGLDPKKLAARCSAREIDDALRREVMEAKSAGIDTAPSFVLGRVTDGKVTGIRMNGAQTFDTLDAGIKKLLSSKGGE